MGKNEYDNSTVLRLYKSPSLGALDFAYGTILDELTESLHWNITKPSDKEKLLWHLHFFLTNLYKTYHKDKSRYISYSRNRNAYKPKSTYKEKFNITQHTMDKADEDHSKDEVVVVKGKTRPKKKVPRIVKGKKKIVKIKRPRRICKTPDTPAVRQMRENLNLINEVMDKADITLDITEQELQELNQRLMADDDPYRQAIDFTNKRLHRVFLDRRLDMGGRFYGPWYQNIYKEYRKQIFINGFPVMEPDFSAYHIAMLYNITGNEMPEGDQYQLDGYSKIKPVRDFLKRLLLIILNTKAKTLAAAKIKAKSRITYEVSYKKKLIQPEEITDLDDLIDKFVEKHKPIEEYFFSGYGNTLQYHDSLIAEQIMLRMAKQGVPCLPVHDSFMIDFRYALNLQLAMSEAYKKAYGTSIDIKDDQAEFYTKMRNTIRRGLKDGTLSKDEWQEAYDKMENIDYSQLPDRQIIARRG